MAMQGVGARLCTAESFTDEFAVIRQQAMGVNHKSVAA